MILSGWWYTYPSEKYDFVSWDDDIPNILWKHNPNVPNHQAFRIIQVFTSPNLSAPFHTNTTQVAKTVPTPIPPPFFSPGIDSTPPPDSHFWWDPPSSKAPKDPNKR